MSRLVPFLAVILLTVAACKTTTIYNVNHAPLPGATDATDEQIAKVIIDAGARQGWIVEPVAPGKMRAVYKKGRHFAVVGISYTASTYDIEYVDSAHLRHDGDKIHKAYNKWVRGLSQAIEREAKFQLE